MFFFQKIFFKRTVIPLIRGLYYPGNLMARLTYSSNCFHFSSISFFTIHEITLDLEVSRNRLITACLRFVTFIKPNFTCREKAPPSTVSQIVLKTKMNGNLTGQIRQITTLITTTYWISLPKKELAKTRTPMPESQL